MPRDGAARYVTCGACHGADGAGIQATNAPRLKGMSDWYLVTQLQELPRRACAAAIRRTCTARRWRLMAAMLRDDQAIDDVGGLHQHADVSPARTDTRSGK